MTSLLCHYRGRMRSGEVTDPNGKEFSQTASPSLPECTRLGGLPSTNVLQVNVFAFDASGNLSGSAYIEAPLPGGIPDVPAPGAVSAVMGVDHTVSLNWIGVSNRPQPNCSACTYRLYYALGRAAGPGVQGVGAIQGAAPIDVGEATSYTLNGLTPGGTYHFRVQSFDTQRRLGALSNDFVLIVTDGIDANLDGLPDDWKTFNNIGAGTLTPVIAPDATWLVTTLNGDVLQIRVNKAGMAAGRYVGHVIVSGAPGNHTQDSPQSITVDVWLAAGNPPIGYYRVFLPLTKK